MGVMLGPASILAVTTKAERNEIGSKPASASQGARHQYVPLLGAQPPVGRAAPFRATFRPVFTQP